jgi:hypothetical protein
MLLRDSYFRTQIGINLFWAIRSVDGASIDQPAARSRCPPIRPASLRAFERLELKPIKRSGY